MGSLEFTQIQTLTLCPRWPETKRKKYLFHRRSICQADTFHISRYPFNHNVWYIVRVVGVNNDDVDADNYGDINYDLVVAGTEVTMLLVLLLFSPGADFATVAASDYNAEEEGCDDGGGVMMMMLMMTMMVEMMMIFMITVLIMISIMLMRWWWRQGWWRRCDYFVVVAAVVDGKIVKLFTGRVSKAF